MLVCIGLASFFSLIFIVLHFPDVDARCPDGYHISPSGDCEIVTHSGGLPRCPDGYHRSPDGDCEQVSSIDDSTDAVEKREPIGGETHDGNDAGSSVSSSPFLAPITQIGECKGSADCFTGIVTEIVDGDTIDVNNVRVRLSMVDTPERGEVGYNEATKITVSICPVGANALIDEDDGQKEGSHDRLIGVVYCNGSTTSLNQILLEEGKATVNENFCDVSEFANDKWVTSFGC